MGRPGKAKAALVRMANQVELHPLNSAEARALTARFLEVRTQVVRQLVEAGVEMGQILEEGRKRFGGYYAEWVTERLGLVVTTAANYVALYRLARHSPALVERHRELGVAKLYKLARVSTERRDELLRTPGLLQMN